jgi:hypothetical protein
MVACPLPLATLPIVGASGAVAGVIESLAVEAVLVPYALVAVTVKVYVVPLESPVTIIGEELAVAVWPPLEVTV